jgi:hypothetical protein
VNDKQIITHVFAIDDAKYRIHIRYHADVSAQEQWWFVRKRKKWCIDIKGREVTQVVRSTPYGRAELGRVKHW